MKRARSWLKNLDAWLEGDPEEPEFDPVHLGGVLVVVMVAVGALYWLLWTLLVYEGGIFIKAGALAQVLFTSKTLADFGYEASPYAMGIFEGWMGNLGALLLTLLALYAVCRLYCDGRSRRK